MRINKRLLKISILPLVCILTLTSFLFGGEFLARKTVDDGQNIRQILEQNPRGQVLGDLENKEQNTGENNFQNKKANSNIRKNSQNSEKVEFNQCPKNFPIIGWIDYSGKKLVKKELPIGQKPTICFENLQNAKLEGYLEN